LELVTYDENYWESEANSALERARSGSLERFLELVVLSRIPIRSWLDMGTGGGQLLDEVNKLFGDVFEQRGIELYPPGVQFRTKHEGFIIGEFEDLKNVEFDAITSIEVLEHLDPQEARKMFENIERLLTNGGIALINSGNDLYVEYEDLGYLDPIYRGHNYIYSLDSVQLLIKDLKLKLIRRSNSNWSFFLQKVDNFVPQLTSVKECLWTTHPFNRQLLYKVQNNDLLFLLGRESLRVYG
jgi:cyclopropane fatty-acyl-phospholipid synthase-like methyltransferase